MKPRVRAVDHVPHIRQQRSVQDVWPKDASGYHEPAAPARQKPTVYPAGTLGRFPTIGIDRGAPPGTAPGDTVA